MKINWFFLLSLIFYAISIGFFIALEEKTFGFIFVALGSVFLVLAAERKKRDTEEGHGHRRHDE